MRTRLHVLLGALVVAGALLSAQEISSPPLVQDADAKTLEIAFQALENAKLRVVIAQQQLELVAQPLVKAGYQISRGQDGRWSYTPQASAPQAAPEAPVPPKGTP